MPSRAELVARANVLGIDTTTATNANDSALEQRVLWNEKRATAITGTIATTTLTSDATTVSNNDTVTIGFPSSSGTTTRVLTFKTALTEAAASSTLTASGVFSDGETITVDGRVYVMRTTLSTNIQTRDEILIGAAATNSLDNIKTTINGTGQGSTTNTQTTIHPTVTATTKTSTTLVVAAKSPGTYGNAYITAETGANSAWTGTTLSGGANPVQNEVLIGANAAANLSNFKAAINDSGTSGTNYSSNTQASRHLIGTTLTATTLVLNAREFAVGNDITTTTTATHLSFTGATLASGVAKVIAPVTAAGNSNRDNISGDAELLV